MPSTNKQEWNESTFEPVKKRFGERRDRFETDSGIEVDTVYTPEDLKSFDYADALGYPGEYPYTRGVQPNMYRGRVWTMRQYSAFASPEESNARYRYLLEHGQTGLSVAFDLPTQTGYDSDHPLAAGEVGRAGVPISSLADMEVLFEDIPLDKVSTSMTINATASILLSLYIAVGKKQGVDPSQLNGTLQNDILKEYIARGTHIYPPRHSMRLVTDVFKYCSEHVPSWNTISISGYHMREAGPPPCRSSPSPSPTASPTCRPPSTPGWRSTDSPHACPSSSPPRTTSSKRSPSSAPPAACGPRSCASASMPATRARGGLRFHTQTAGCHPHGPAARQQRHPHDRAGARRRARRHPVAPRQLPRRGPRPPHRGVRPDFPPHPADSRPRERRHRHRRSPAGSYYVESLTDRLEEAAFDYIAEIDRQGGAVTALESGYQTDEIHESAFKLQREIEERGPDRRRRKPVHDRDAAHPAVPAHRPRGRPQADRARPASPPRARRGRDRRRPPTPPRRRRRHRQHRPRHPRMRRVLRHRRRDSRRLPQRLRRTKVARPTDSPRPDCEATPRPPASAHIRYNGAWV